MTGTDQQDQTPSGDRARERYRRLPEPVRPEDMSTSVPASAAGEGDLGIDTDLEFFIRHIG